MIVFSGKNTTLPYSVQQDGHKHGFNIQPL